MKSANGFKPGLGCLIVTGALLGGCVMTPAPGHYASEVVTVAPPTPRVEVYGAPPVAGYVWLDGYWDWVGGRYVWHTGSWGPGRPGYHWVSHTWVHVGAGWRMTQEHWVR